MSSYDSIPPPPPLPTIPDFGHGTTTAERILTAERDRLRRELHTIEAALDAIQGAA